jgi:NAD(P)-dependent dehydrogenase (short-subunit alcohol dehydrogenase family)
MMNPVRKGHRNMPESPPSKGRVADKVALVTGAGSGIGRATAVVLAAHGAAIACSDLNLAGAEETAAAITASGGSSNAYRLDVTAEPTWLDLMEQIQSDFGRLDIAVNCAGISFACPVADMSLEDWRRVMAVNLEGVFLGTKHAIRAMRQAGRGGSIINVSSVSGIKAQPEASAYCASKAAVIQFSKAAALECQRRGENIRVNCISPTGVKTPMWKTMPFFQELMAKEGGEEAAFRAMAQSAPYGRWAFPEEVALAILFLASDESSFLAGTNLVFDSGDTA